MYLLKLIYRKKTKCRINVWVIIDNKQDVSKSICDGACLYYIFTTLYIVYNTTFDDLISKLVFIGLYGARQMLLIFSHYIRKNVNNMTSFVKIFY